MKATLTLFLFSCLSITRNKATEASPRKHCNTDQDAKSELVMKAKNKVVRPRSFPLVLPLDEVLTTLRESTNHGHAYIYLCSLSQLAVGI